MKGKTILIILLILGVVGLFWAGIYPFSVYGSYISVDEIDFKSSSDWWTGKTWVVTALQYGMGQTLIGRISAEEMQDESGASIRPVDDLTIELLDPVQTCEWTALSDDHLYTYYYSTWTTWLPVCSDSDGLQKCNIGYLATITEPGFSIPKKCMCIGKKFYGRTGQLTDETVRTKTTLRLKNSKETINANIDTKGDSSGWLGDEGYYKYHGSLLLDSCRSEKPSMVYYRPIYKDGLWYFVLESKYDDYDDALVAWDNYYRNNIINGKWLDHNWNAVELRNLINNVQASINNLASVSTGGEFEANTYKETLLHPKTNPMYTIYLKADWLGIYQLIPDIRIENARCEPAGSYGQSYNEITLRNYGESGEATISVNCDTPFTDNSKTIQMDNSEQLIYQITYSVYGNQQLERNCLITVQNEGGSRYTRTTTCKFEPDKMCEKDATICKDAKVIEKCFNPYVGWQYSETCPSGEECRMDKYGEAKCVESGKPKICGDGICEGTETCDNCIVDCGCLSGYTCKDGECVKGGFQFDLDTMVLILISVLGFGTLGLIAKKSMGKKGKRKR